ncbi:MAG: PorV/PorQ family protein, partial [Ignavibacterium album]|nr:PorV/PorQ family protein [Ignavibacterium album]
MKKIFLLLITAGFATLLYAGDVARKGTNGAEELLIPVGARSIATSGAFVANVMGLESIYYNPAGLDISQRTEAMFSYMNYIADINISYLAIGTSLGDFGSIALSIKSLDVGNIPVTTNELPDGTGSTYSPGFVTVGLTYSKVLTDRVSIGTNVKLLSETIGNTSATGFAIDAGVQYKFTEQISLGATVKNIGSNMVFSGQDLRQRSDIKGSQPGSPTGMFEVVAESFQIPSYFELSLAYGLNLNEENDLMFAGAFTANNSLENKLHFGLEYGYMNTFFLRGGYQLFTENTKESIYGFTAGAGVNYDFS